MIVQMSKEMEEEILHCESVVRVLYRIFTEPKYVYCAQQVVQQLSPRQAIELMRSCASVARFIRSCYDWRRLFMCDTSNNDDISVFPGLFEDQAESGRFSRAELCWISKEPKDATNFLQLFVTLQHINRAYFNQGVLATQKCCYMWKQHPLLKQLQKSESYNDSSAFIEEHVDAVSAAIDAVQQLIRDAINSHSLSTLCSTLQEYKIHTEHANYRSCKTMLDTLRSYYTGTTNSGDDENSDDTVCVLQ